MRGQRATPRDFESEAHLCEVFAERARAAGLGVYPEVGEWDLLLVVPATATRGELQIGVEAKLRSSLELVHQAHRRMGMAPRRPHGAAVLVPAVSQALLMVCRALAISALDLDSRLDRLIGEMPTWDPDGRPPLELPRFDVPHLRAGAPSPRPLTEWREKAIRLCIRLRDRGFVTTADFRELGVSKRWWTGPGGPLAPAGMQGRYAAYQARAGAKLPDEGWEAVVQQIREREAA